MQSDQLKIEGVTFRDAELQRRYEEDGYATFSYLTADQLKELRELSSERDEDNGGFHWSAISSDLSYRQKMASQVLRICGASIERTFVDGKGVNATLLIKPPSDPGGEIPPHLDWTFVEEPRLTSCTVWCPLADTTVEAGGIHVLPRSHRLVTAPRGTPYIPSVFDSLPREEVLDCGRYVPLRAGEAIAWDTRLLHWSPPNQTQRPRIAVAMAVVPAGAELFHYFLRDDGTVQKYAVEDEAFFGSLNLGEEPNARHLGEVQMPAGALDVETLRRVCGSAEEQAPLKRLFKRLRRK